jgi:hypothetical protein
VATLNSSNNVITVLNPVPMLVDNHMKMIGMVSGVARKSEPAMPTMPAALAKSVYLVLFQISCTVKRIMVNIGTLAVSLGSRPVTAQNHENAHAIRECHHGQGGNDEGPKGNAVVEFADGHAEE